MELTVPLLTWSSIVIIIAVMALISLVHSFRLSGHHIVEIGSEREELFVPGDIVHPDPKDYDDFDD